MTAEVDPRPAPPWSELIDLRTFSVVELPAGLMTSPGIAGLSAEAFRAVFRLLEFAWHQVPAGSVPEDPHTLADAAGYGRDVAAWQAIQVEALGVFVHCIDNRFYFSPWQEILEAADGRRKKRSAGRAVTALRSRFRRELADLGVINVEGIAIETLDKARELAVDRGIKDMRGDRRAQVLASVAGEFGLLPREIGDDLRLAAKFGGSRGLRQISEVKRGSP